MLFLMMKVTAQKDWATKEESKYLEKEGTFVGKGIMLKLFIWQNQWQLKIGMVKAWEYFDIKFIKEQMKC